MKVYVKPDIYAIMITNDTRRQFVPRAIDDFHEQTYPHKHLIILNHGQNPYFNSSLPEITEIMIDKKTSTLGDMRNLALTFVPINAFWITWDDDDIRSPEYFGYLAKEIGDNDALFLRDRMEFNISNGYVYRSRFQNGSPHFLCSRKNGISYLSRDSLEDLELYRDLKKLNRKIRVIDNDPLMYLRLIHGSNTSLYVDRDKRDIIDYSKESNYREFRVSDREAKNVMDIYKERWSVPVTVYNPN